MKNKKDSARKALDRCMEVIPDKVVPFNVYNRLLIEAYYRLGEVDTANKMAATLKENIYQDMNYFVSLGKKYSSYLTFEKRVAFFQFAV